MKIPVLTIGLSLGLIGLYAVFGAIPETLVWKNDIGGRWWQWGTSHFVHISLEHLIWNTIAFFILGWIIEQRSKHALLLSVGAGIFAVDIYLSCFYKLPAYTGLSGVLNTLWVVAFYKLQRIPGYKLAARISFAASIFKLGYEWCSQSSIFSSLNWPSVPEAHLAGLLGGLSLCLYLILFHDDKHSTLN